MHLFSPAKINLFFRVLRKRPDGFHDIAMMIAVVSLFDEIEMSLSKADSFFCDDATLPHGSGNLIWKAVSLFRTATGLNHPVDISLLKQIPVEAGLGGGSGNAATTLWGLNAMLGSPLSLSECIDLGGQLGSDVALFFSSGCAYCTGRGEIVVNTPFMAIPNLWVAKPKRYKLATHLVFKHCTPSFSNQEPLDDILEGYHHKDPSFFNDLEAAAFSLVPALKAVKQDLFSLGFSDVMMTGSGTAFFCIGSPNSLDLDGVDLFPVHVLQREEKGWWKPSKNFEETLGFVTLENQIGSAT